jgi:hypothetical protein
VTGLPIFRIYTAKETFVIDPVNYEIKLQRTGKRLPYDLVQAIGERLEAVGIY